MPTLRGFYLVEARPSYLEQILAALGPINPIVDPEPSDLSRLGTAELLARSSTQQLPIACGSQSRCYAGRLKAIPRRRGW
jgi:hypothetical protein